MYSIYERNSLRPIFEDSPFHYPSHEQSYLRAADLRQQHIPMQDAEVLVSLSGDEDPLMSMAAAERDQGSLSQSPFSGYSHYQRGVPVHATGVPLGDSPPFPSFPVPSVAPYNSCPSPEVMVIPGACARRS